MLMNHPFVLAEPVWLAGRAEEMNVRVVLQAGFTWRRGESVRLKLTGSTLYRIFVNGSFAAYGPARAAHGHVRIDELDLGEFAAVGANVLSVEVAGYNCYSYYTLNAPSFLQAELEVAGHVVAATRADESGEADGTGVGNVAGGEKLDTFIGFAHSGHVRKTMRYSFQRTFSEAYTLDHTATDWHHTKRTTGETLARVPLDVRYLPRVVPLPDYRIVQPERLTETGRAEISRRGPDHAYRRLRFVHDLPDWFSGFPLDEIEIRPYERLQDMTFSPEVVEATQLGEGALGLELASGAYARFELPCNNTGFIVCELEVREDCELYLLFDEKLIDGQMDLANWQSLNVVRYALQAGRGTYRLETFECYGFKHLQLIVLQGAVRLDMIGLREYAYPHDGNAKLQCGDEQLDRIFAAAIETYRQNTVDVFMDCPTRERAGWLCDSYFTAQSARFFSGETLVEQVMLEQYAHAGSFPFLPQGMLPMCYPADHPNGNHIPQWALWYIIELAGYYRRAKDANPDHFRNICYGILGALQLYRNEDGLLEKLDGWNFVEWSDANKWVHDVNYPTNMLYAKVLTLVGGWYGDKALTNEANRLRRKIVEQSFDGRFFIDHAVRDEQGRLRPETHKSEVCQYYAFFFDIADGAEEAFGRLRHTLLTEFGPERQRLGLWPEVAKANAFIGNYLRMELLLRWGRYRQVIAESRDYFYPMAERTGTLWEHDDVRSGSLNHGFASVIGVYLIRCLLGVQELDGDEGTVVFDLEPMPGSRASGQIGTAHGMIRIWRESVGERTRLAVCLPRGLRLQWLRGQAPEHVELDLSYA